MNALGISFEKQLAYSSPVTPLLPTRGKGEWDRYSSNDVKADADSQAAPAGFASCNGESSRNATIVRREN